MGTHLLIDGYNLIGHLEGMGKGDLERARSRLLERLQAYRRVRPHAITVVFDGRVQGWPTEQRDRVGGITVVYSAQGTSADEVILREVDRHGTRYLVVTSDRELAASVERRGGHAVSAEAFHQRMVSALWGTPAETEEEEIPLPRLSTRKRGNPRRLPKAQRRKAARLRKL